MVGTSRVNSDTLGPHPFPQSRDRHFYATVNPMTLKRIGLHPIPDGTEVEHADHIICRLMETAARLSKVEGPPMGFDTFLYPDDHHQVLATAEKLTKRTKQPASKLKIDWSDYSELFESQGLALADGHKFDFTAYGFSNDYYNALTDRQRVCISYIDILFPLQAEGVEQTVDLPLGRPSLIQPLSHRLCSRHAVRHAPAVVPSCRHILHMAWDGDVACSLPGGVYSTILPP